MYNTNYENVDNAIMETEPDEQFLKNYQAIYYAMNAKPDCKTKIFGKRVIVEMEDLKELNKKITDKFKSHYEDAGFSINVTVSFSDHTSVEFNSWTMFERYDWAENRVVNNITIKWEYNAKLPQYPIPQKHTLVVRIANEIRPEEMFNLLVSGKLEEINQIDQEVCPIIARVDFINSILGEELLSIVSSWQDGLQSNEDDVPMFIKIAKKFRRLIAYMINYIAVICSLFFCYEYLKEMMNKIDVGTLGEIPVTEIQEIIFNIIVLVILVWIVNRFFTLIANMVYSLLGASMEHHTFNITKGDVKRRNEIIKRLNKNAIKIIINIIITIFFNVLCSIIANNLQLLFS